MTHSLVSRHLSTFKALSFAVWAVLFGPLQGFASLLDAGVDLGVAGPDPQWGIFTLGNGAGPNQIGGTSLIFGHVGIGGLDDFEVRGYSTIEGDVLLRKKSDLALSGNAHIIGNVAFAPANVALLKQGLVDAKGASEAAFQLTKTQGFPTTIDTNQSLTLTGSGVVVLKLSDFRLRGNAALTLEGDSNTTFVIDVKNEFGMGGNSRVTLSGGLTWNNVLFNLGGEGDAFLAKNAQLDGIILARKRTVEVKGSAQVRGEIVAGRVVLSGASVVGRIPVVSP